MSSDFNNWNAPYKRHRRPSGLTGRQIGMFYRNRGRQVDADGKKIKQEFSITFSMPPPVMVVIKKNIQTLLRTAQKENITLPPLKQNYIETEVSSIKREPQEYECTDTKTKSKDETFSNIDCSKTKSKPVEESDVCSGLKDETMKVEVTDQCTAVSSIKREPQEHECTDTKTKSKDETLSNIDCSKTKSKPVEESDECSGLKDETMKVEVTDQCTAVSSIKREPQEYECTDIKTESKDETLSNIDCSKIKLKPVEESDECSGLKDESIKVEVTDQCTAVSSIKREPQEYECTDIKTESKDETLSNIDCSKIKSKPVEETDVCSGLKDEAMKVEVTDQCTAVSSIKREPQEYKCTDIKTESKDETLSNIYCSKLKSEPVEESDECSGLKDEPMIVEVTDQCTPGLSNEISAVKDERCESNPNVKFDKACTSTAPFNLSDITKLHSIQNQLDLRYSTTFKYGYEDIITGTFEEKLEENLAKGIEITRNNSQNNDINVALLTEYKDMIQESGYKKMLEFRKILPTYAKSKEILDAIEKHQVLVISGETGCGKSTQVPQIILDDAISNNRGAYVKILVTQPRRIAASSLATRVAKERAELPGNSVGYAVRLERIQERPRGSIQYCTTGILLADLETNQSLTNFSHIILDEVHERDSHIDLAMCMLKQVLKKRTDLKLILMSATIDAESLSAYFDDCLRMHIEGLAYPVKDVYLEEVLGITKYRLPNVNFHKRNKNLLKHKIYNKNKRLKQMDDKEEQKQQEYFNEVGDWINSKKNELDVNVIASLKNPKIEELNFDIIVELIKYISNGAPGAILVFVPGFTDISKLVNILKESHFRPPRFEIYSLHSKLPSLEQNKIFEKPPMNVRKIIVATNIAETSITIDDVVYVIDSGRHKIKGLNVERNFETLNVELISKANLRQRRGRAGRCQPGVCYHMLTSFRAEKLPERTLPELQRSNLLEAVLMIKRLRLGLANDALKHVPSPPAESSVAWAVNHLQRCGALNAAESLTPLGWHMARLPVHPAAGKLLLLGALTGCLDRAASVAAVWGFKDPYVMVIGKEYEIEKCKRQMTLGEPSDHIAISEAIINFERCPRHERRNYCFGNFLSYNTCELLSEMKKQLGANLKAMGFLPSGSVKSERENRNANNLSLFKAIIAAALYPNIATTRWIGLRSRKPNPNIRVIPRTPEDGKVSIHPSSVLANVSGSKKGGRSLTCKPGANWLVYWMKQKTAQLYVFEVTLIYSLPLLFFGDFILSEDPDVPNGYILDVSSIKVRVKKGIADLLYDLRVLLDHVLAAKVMSSSNHSTRSSKFEDQVLNTVIELITAEDEQAEYVGEDLTDSDFSENDTEGSLSFRV